MSAVVASLVLVCIGLTAGVVSGVFGIGGGILIVPGLIYLMKYSTHQAIGTSLAILLPPVGLAAVIEYARHGNVDFRAAFLVAAALFAGAWLGAVIANRLHGPYLRLAFGIFVVCIGVYLVFGAVRRLGWV